ncbi:hypothetical protein CB1_016133005 [Camelus ferus]|nr:hypothetical protein CB1_016133005 [Camelus ferus]
MQLAVAGDRFFISPLSSSLLLQTSVRLCKSRTLSVGTRLGLSQVTFRAAQWPVSLSKKSQAGLQVTASEHPSCEAAFEAALGVPTAILTFPLKLLMQLLPPDPPCCLGNRVRTPAADGQGSQPQGDLKVAKTMRERDGRYKESLTKEQKIMETHAFLLCSDLSYPRSHLPSTVPWRNGPGAPSTLHLHQYSLDILMPAFPESCMRICDSSKLKSSDLMTHPTFSTVT